MTVYVETDFLLALMKDEDWLQERAESALADRTLVTSPYSYLEVLLIRERYEFEVLSLVSNMLELVPVASDREHQVVLKATNYVDDGMTAFDAFHAATAETDGLAILGSDQSYENADVQRIPLEE